MQFMTSRFSLQLGVADFTEGKKKDFRTRRSLQAAGRSPRGWFGNEIGERVGGRMQKEKIEEQKAELDVGGAESFRPENRLLGIHSASRRDAFQSHDADLPRRRRQILRQPGALQHLRRLLVRGRNHRVQLLQRPLATLADADQSVPRDEDSRCGVFHDLPQVAEAQQNSFDQHHVGSGCQLAVKRRRKVRKVQI